MGRKVINIEENVYEALKQYCEQGGYKIAKFVERLISERIGYVDTKLQRVQKVRKK